MKKEYSIRRELTNQESDDFKGFSGILSHLMFHRGISSKEANLFVEPSFSLGLNDPFLLHDMEKVVKRIIKAIKADEKICIYSDYDADGLSGATIFYDFFKQINFINFINHIPNRNEEGFGLHIESIEKIIKEGVSLIITVDCGIGDIEEAKFAKKLGVDLIITDHHEPAVHRSSAQNKADRPDYNLPDAFAIINPKISPDYPEKMLCGAAVAWKVVCAIISKNEFKLPLGFEKWIMDVVGIATLSDMVPLVGENRLLSKFGMLVLKKSRRVGIQRLLKTLKIDIQNLTEDDIGFMITPRINAASRMGKSIDAFRLLTTTSEDEAKEIVLELEKTNNERKVISAHLSKEVKKMMEEKYSPHFSNKVIALGSPNWKPSILGIVAGNIVEKENKPVFLWGKEEGSENIKGSCRAPEGVSIKEIMENVLPGIIINFGGHHMAGGFSLSNETVHLFESEIEKAFETSLSEAKETSEAWVDRKIDIENVDLKLINEIEKLSPFGMANEKPIFILSDGIFEKVDFFGKEKKHLKIILKGKKGKLIEAISFFTSEDLIAKAKQGEKIDIVGNVEKSFFGYPKARIRIIDILE
ncbi:MAG: single-stranded-DNA-specific exonuclease RecJ [bacterium]